MAATTVTSAQLATIYGDVPGLNFRHARLNWRSDIGASSLSVSVCAQMVGVPNGARIIGVVTQMTGQTGMVGSYLVGDGSSTNRFQTIISLTASSVVNRTAPAGGYGYRVSVTESDFLTFDTIDLTFGANVTSTLTLVVDMMVYYLMDRQNTGEA